ncbi:hypothetical protein DL98DRAFT_437191, partial [Cadophora sp. DSE1049]
AIRASFLWRPEEETSTQALVCHGGALQMLRSSLSNPARNTSELVLCLLLCIYEILSSGGSLHLHLAGASALIRSLGMSKLSSHLRRFFHLLDISNAVISSRAPAWDNYGDLDLAGPYPWPVYDTKHVAITSFQKLMAIMAKMACLSEASRNIQVQHHSQEIYKLYHDLRVWWMSCPPQIRSQENNWRCQERKQKLGLGETLHQELFSRIRACFYGCKLYLHHILHPLGADSLDRNLEKAEGATAVQEILEIVGTTPLGYGLELGLDWSVFMLGVSVVNDFKTEEFVRKWLCQPERKSPYPASSLTLLEALWKQQHQDGRKHDWRQVKAEAGINWWV